MIHDIDVREPLDRVDDDRRAALDAAAEEVSDNVLPGDHRVRVMSLDAGTGNAAVVTSHDASPGDGDHVARALRHLQRISPALGLTADQAPEYVADPAEQTTSAGAVAVHLRQQYKGILIYDAAETVRFEPDGSIREVAGRSVSAPADLPVTPTVTPEQALRAAAAHVGAPDDPADAPRDQFGQPLVDPGMDLSGFAPVQRTSGADRPDRPTTFDAPPFQHAVTVSLIWFPIGETLRLAWHTKLAVPGGTVFRIIVDATDGSLLLVKRLTQAIAGRAGVVLRPGAPAAAVDLPLDPTAYGAPLPANLPAGFPDDWLVDATTRGSSVSAVIEPGSKPVTGASQNGQVVFQTDPVTPDGLAVNLFALCSSMHDLLYLLGFRESDGNFQADNLGRGGRQLDPVLAHVHPGAVWGTANMGTPPDGSQPTMNMGLVTSTNRHTALDADVVFHEYTHGLTNRLVGGALDDSSLDAIQSSGMGEGWSDFFACTAMGKTVVGDWVVNQPNGIRRFRYDESFPDDYGKLGTGRYDEVHNIGELWCATLMSLSRAIGAWTAAQVVVDALKLTAANPSFLAARDGILLAADHYSQARGDDATARADFVHAVWSVFAQHGMGPQARTGGAANLTGIVTDFEPPPRPTSTATVRGSASPALAIPDNQVAGVISRITLPDGGPVHAVEVTVDITHTYVGDLEVRLLAPDGRTVTLHSRAGSSSRDLHQTWSSDSLAGLEALAGMPSGGVWTLRVGDRAPRGTGQRGKWWIEMAVGGARAGAEAEATPALAIPDNKPTGIRSEVVIAETGTVSALQLDVDITHTYIGDLEVKLVSPDGTRVKVHGRTGTSSDNLITTYTSETGALAPFVGKPVQGTWALIVADRAGQDVGKLNRWRIAATL
jgi:extracellular elastinolytic metalloproteinase